MKKRIVFSGLGFVALVASSAIAGSPFSGVFLGGDLGGSYGGTHQSTNQDRTPIENVRIRTSGVVGGLNFGFSHTFENCFFLGGGLYGGFSRLKGSHKRESRDCDFDVNFKMRNFVGIQLEPGIVVGKETPILFHLVGALEFGKWKLNTSSKRYFLIAAANGVTLNDKASCNKRLKGLTVGFGMAGMVSKGLALGLKYTHTRYKKLPTLEHQNQQYNRHNLTFNFKPTDNRVMVTLRKYFG